MSFNKKPPYWRFFIKYDVLSRSVFMDHKIHDGY